MKAHDDDLGLAVPRHVPGETASERSFQPMNINFGLFAPLEPEAPAPRGAGKKLEKARILERAGRDLDEWAAARAFPPVA